MINIISQSTALVEVVVERVQATRRVKEDED